MEGAIPNQDVFFPFMFVQAEFQRHVRDLFTMSQRSAETKVTIFIKFHTVTLLEELPLKKWLKFYYFKKHVQCIRAKTGHCSAYIPASASFCVPLRFHLFYASIKPPKMEREKRSS